MRAGTDKTVADQALLWTLVRMPAIRYAELAARILALPGGCPIVHTDDFASWDEPLQWWPRMLTEALQPLARGERARFRRYDWDAQRIGDELLVEPEAVVLVEGVSSSRSEFAELLAFRIWVETPRPVRLQRGVARDGPGFLAQWEVWMAAEDAYVARDRPDVRVDVVVDGTSER
jgi:uridine kinase